MARSVPVGVDVEGDALRGDQVPDIALCSMERKALEALPADRRGNAFITYWTRKEAILKATGDGLLVDLGTITVSEPSAPPALLRWDNRPDPPLPVHLEPLDPGPGYQAHVAMLGQRLRVVQRSATVPLARWRRRSGHHR
jgi:4'-phosphopantetheinyl transferase